MNTYKISFKWVGAATWILQIDDLKIASDPILCKKNSAIDLKYFKAKRRTDPQFSSSDFENIDFWLLTHNHTDHIDRIGISKISVQSQVYSHKNLKPWFANQKDIKITYMRWGEKINLSKNSISIDIEAITCVHGSNFLSAILSGGCNGYWIKITKAENPLYIYVTGDTVDHPKVINHIAERNVDILIPNLGGSGLGRFGGPYTLTARTFKNMLSLINPKIVLPVHHISFSLFKETIEELYKLNDKRIVKFGEGETVHL
ncbi:MAG: MBL fold metallo-hydrolase [Bacteroidales bacterium]|nr:MBL fold metallo-hydrolase [Bacteroidales bacterium]